MKRNFSQLRSWHSLIKADIDEYPFWKLLFTNRGLWPICLRRPWNRPTGNRDCKHCPTMLGCDAGHRPTHPGLHRFPLCFLRVRNGKLPNIAPEIDFDGDRKAHGYWPRLMKRYHLILSIFCVRDEIYVPRSASLFLVYMAVWAAHSPSTMSRAVGKLFTPNQNSWFVYIGIASTWHIVNLQGKQQMHLQ